MGAQFTKDELASYKGLKIDRIKFAIGAAIGEFKVGVYTAKGTALSKSPSKTAMLMPGLYIQPNFPRPLKSPVKKTSTSPIMELFPAALLH